MSHVYNSTMKNESCSRIFPCPFRIIYEHFVWCQHRQTLHKIGIMDHLIQSLIFSPFLVSTLLYFEERVMLYISSKIQFVFLRISFKKNFLLFLFRSFIINHVRHNRVSIALNYPLSKECNMPPPLARSDNLRPYYNWQNYFRSSKSKTWIVIIHFVLETWSNPDQTLSLWFGLFWLKWRYITSYTFRKKIKVISTIPR